MAIARPLTFIIKYSMLSGDVPNDMKLARVTPVFKHGDPTVVKNYRPISVLSSFSKIIERIVYSRTLDYLDKHISMAFWPNTQLRMP